MYTGLVGCGFDVGKFVGCRPVQDSDSNVPIHNSHTEGRIMSVT